MKRFALLAGVVALFAGLSPLAAASSKPAPALDFCVKPAPGATSEPRAPKAPLFKTGGFCLAADCSSNEDCGCSGAIASWCDTITWTCQYQFSGGGGNPGGGSGSYCIPMSDCSDNSNCSFCGGYCGTDWTCHHY